MHHLDLIGTVPRPNGGVAQHVWRLAMQMARYGCRVLDLYPAEVKYPLPGVMHQQAPNSWLLKAAWLHQKLRHSPAVATHFHFSTTNAFSLGHGWIPPRRAGQVRILTLHHGQLLERHQRMRRLSRRVAAISIRQFDRVVALSDAQHEFYTDEIGVPVDRLVRASSHIHLPGGVMRTGRLQLAGKAARVMLVASGGLAPHYGHEHALRLIHETRGWLDAQLHLCLYGPRDEAYLEKIQQRAGQSDRVTLHFDLDLPEFLRILAAADVYLRPSTIDSFGLAVADAIALGVPAVASDVCGRCRGAVVFPAGDYDAFEQAVERVVSNLPRERRLIAQLPLVDSLAAYLHAYDLPAQVDAYEYRRAA